MVGRAGLRRGVAALALMAVMAACSPQDGQLFDSAFWASSPIKSNERAELGIAELAKGNFVAAEAHFDSALRTDPKDINALMGSAILYQSTGQPVRARERYEAVLALKPTESQQFVAWSALSAQPAAQVARTNLAQLDKTQRRSGQPARPAATPAAVRGAPSSAPLLGRPAKPASTGGAGKGTKAFVPPANNGSLKTFSAAEKNIVSRFTTLRALRDQGLITPGEFTARRRANIGALLPLSSPPPSAGLGRSVPTTEQISNRLRSIGRALELRSITPGQHKAERDLILDALVPAAPTRVAARKAPPRNLLAAADSIRKIENLRTRGFISTPEYNREKVQIEKSVKPTGPKTTAKKAPVKKVDKKATASGKKTPKPGVHLASYRSEKQAQNGWKALKKRHGSLLKGLSPEVAKVNLGKKGTFFRLKAGPVKDKASAKSLCTNLKRRRQFCETTQVNG